MLPVLLDPTIRSTGAIAAVLLRDQPFQPHRARMPERIRADLVLFERCKVDAIRHGAPGLCPVHEFKNQCAMEKFEIFPWQEAVTVVQGTVTASFIHGWGRKERYGLLRSQ